MSMLIMPARFGGSAALWTPADLAVPPACWLNDDSTIVPNGNGYRWNDRTANGCDFGSTVASYWPVVNATGLNGRRTLTFDGANNYLAGSTNARMMTANIGALSMFVIARPAPVTTSGAVGRIVNLSHGGSNTSSRAMLALLNGNADSRQRRLDTDSAAFADTPYTAQAWRIFETEHDYTGQSVGVRLDGGTLTTTATGQGSGNTSNTISYEAAIGGGSDVSQFMQGDLAEIVVLQYIPSLADRQTIEGYLAWRWGLQANLPAGHPYKSAPP